MDPGISDYPKALKGKLRMTRVLLMFYRSLEKRLSSLSCTDSPFFVRTPGGGDIPVTKSGNPSTVGPSSSWYKPRAALRAPQLNSSKASPLASSQVTDGPTHWQELA